MDSMVRKSLLTVGLDEYHAERYPHEFSGGQQRRIALARILILGPSVVIFDEPTSGVDVSVQATILKLLEKIKKLYALTYVHISHNLDVIRLVSDRIAVMYLGKIVEVGDVTSTAENALHPYTRILFSAVPKIGRPRENSEPEVLITGEPPDPQYPPSGCHFHPRCPISQDICTKENPVLRKVAGDRFVACHIAEDGLTK
jgi:oligopeptide/dipeptide ABC transporter ATP-binding protein